MGGGSNLIILSHFVSEVLKFHYIWLWDLSEIVEITSLRGCGKDKRFQVQIVDFGSIFTF